MSLPLWMSLEPRGAETRLMLTAPSGRPMLRARLPSTPAHPRAVITLLESITLWCGQPLHAVIDADAQDVRRYPEKWAMLLGDAPELAVHVEWTVVRAERRRRDRFLGVLGDFASGERLMAFAATGVR